MLPETDAEAGEILKFSDLNYRGLPLAILTSLVKSNCVLTSGLRLVSVKVSVVSPGAEKALDVTITGGEWNTVELDLADYSDAVDLTQVIQLKFDAQELDDGLNTFYMDNLAFAGTPDPVDPGTSIGGNDGDGDGVVGAVAFADTTVVLEVVENTGEGQVVHTAVATDPNGGTLLYALDGDDAGAFTIDMLSGVVTLTRSPDYEAQPSYSFTVLASNGADTATQTVTLNVGDLDDVSGPQVAAPSVTLDADDVDVYVATEWGGNALGGVLTNPNPRLGTVRFRGYRVPPTGW